MPETFTGYTPDALKFMSELRRNNDRTWFQKNKKRFDESITEPTRLFVDALGERLESIEPDIQYDPKVNGSILRIARDTRFSKDKTPYSEHVTLRFWLGKDKKGPGFWMRFNDQMFGIGAGAMMFDDKLLAKYRKRVDADKTGTPLAKLVARLRKKGHETMGEHYKRVPRGFDAEHPREDLLRHRGLFVYRESKVPAELKTKALVTHSVKRCKEVAPVLAWLADC